MEINEVYTDNSFNPNQPTQVVNIPYSLFKSFLGRYYIGHTPFMTLKCNCNAWGGLLNPRNSGANLFVDTFTVTNSSNAVCCAKVWLNSSPIGKFCESSCVSLANTAIAPMPCPCGILAYAQCLPSLPFDGQSVFTQIVRPCSTAEINFDGKVIVAPGSTCIVFLTTPDPSCNCVEVGCRWWEEPVSCKTPFL